jgi:hypothetical protein
LHSLIHWKHYVYIANMVVFHIKEFIYYL